jgi:hypothetical protein
MCGASQTAAHFLKPFHTAQRGKKQELQAAPVFYI